MKYCMDASALVDLGERHYPERLIVFKPIWDHLYEGVDNGDIISVDYVKVELERIGAPWRTDFLSRASEMFLISQRIEEHYGHVIASLEEGGQFPANKQRDRFVSGADPWLIALSKSIDGDSTVVSSEKKPLKDYGLGEVCGQLGVRHIDLVDFFEENSIGHEPF